MRRSRILLLCVAVMAALLVVASPSSAATSAKWGPSYARAVAGERITASGTVSTKIKRKVTLQQKQGKKWRSIASTSTNAKGAFRVAFTARKSGPLRIVASKAKRTKKYTSGAKPFALSTQAGSLAVPGVVLRTQQATMTATLSPARPGRPVTLQGLSGSRWITISTAVQNARGQASFTVVAAELGTHSFRAVTGSSNGIPAFGTGARSMRTDEFEVELSPSARPLTSTEQESIRTVDLDANVLTFEGAAPAGVVPGKIVTVDPREGAPSGALLKVTNVTTVGATTTVETTEADLPDVIERMPESQGEIVMCSIDTEVTDVAEGVTVDDDGSEGSCPVQNGRIARGFSAKAGVVELSTPPIETTLDMTHEWSPLSGVTGTVELEGKLSSALLVEVGLDTNWYGGVTGYHLGGGVRSEDSVEARVRLSGKVEGKKTRKIDVVKVVRSFGGFVGPVPVWADLEGALVAEASLEGKVGFGWKYERSGVDVIGVRNTSHSDMTPVSYARHSSSTGSLLNVSASGVAGLTVGPQIQLSIYSIGGPYLEMGGKAEGTFGWSSSAGTECKLEAGPYAKIGLQTSDALKKLTGGHQSGISAERFVKLIDASLCPPGTDLTETDPTPTPTPTPTEPTPTDPTSTPPVETIVEPADLGLPADTSIAPIDLSDDGTTALLSISGQVAAWQVGSDQLEYLGAASGARLSGDGRYVTVTSPSGGPLVQHDLVTGTADQVIPTTTTMFSGHFGEAPDETLDSSSTGRYVVFISATDGLVPGDDNGTNDAFLWDREAPNDSRITRLSRPSTYDAPAPAIDVGITDDGETVAWSQSIPRPRQSGGPFGPELSTWSRSTGTSRVVGPAPNGRALLAGGGGAAVISDCVTPDPETGTTAACLVNLTNGASSPILSYRGIGFGEPRGGRVSDDARKGILRTINFLTGDHPVSVWRSDGPPTRLPLANGPAALSGDGHTILYQRTAPEVSTSTTRLILRLEAD